jgi:hypothetical protein
MIRRLGLPHWPRRTTEPSPTFGLALGATWLAAESDALRRVRKDPEFEALDAGVAVTLAVAAINRDYLTIVAQ